MNTLTKNKEQRTKNKEQNKDIRDNDCVSRAAALQTEDWSRVGSEYR
jgi:hypothetical protein